MRLTALAEVTRAEGKLKPLGVGFIHIELLAAQDISDGGKQLTFF